MVLNNRELWYVFTGVVIIWVVWLWKLTRRKKLFTGMFGEHWISQVNLSLGREWFSLVMLSIGWLFAGFSALGPMWGRGEEHLAAPGLPVVFVVDVSNSMACDDVVPTRLDVAKSIISTVIGSGAPVRVGLVVYAGGAYPLLPLTEDLSAFSMFVSALHTKMLTAQGTDIGAGLWKALDVLGDEGGIVILLSDGEDYGGGWKECVSECSKRGITVYAVGIGTKEGGPVPLLDDTGEKKGYKEENGKVVVSHLEEDVLKEIAQATGGVYFPVDRAASGVLKVLRSRFFGYRSGVERSFLVHRYRIFLVIGIVFLMVGLCSPLTRRLV